MLPVIMMVLAVLSAIGAAGLGVLSSQAFEPVFFVTGALVSVSTGVARYTVWLICILSAATVLFFGSRSYPLYEKPQLKAGACHDRKASAGNLLPPSG